MPVNPVTKQSERDPYNLEHSFWEKKKHRLDHLKVSTCSRLGIQRQIELFSFLFTRRQVLLTRPASKTLHVVRP